MKREKVSAGPLSPKRAGTADIVPLRCIMPAKMATMAKTIRTGKGIKLIVVEVLPITVVVVVVVPPELGSTVMTKSQVLLVGLYT